MLWRVQESILTFSSFALMKVNYFRNQHFSFLLFPILRRWLGSKNSSLFPTFPYVTWGICLFELAQSLIWKSTRQGEYETKNRVFWEWGEVSPEEGMATHSSILAWRIPWTEEPGGLQSIRSQRVGHFWSNLVHTHTAVPARLRRCAELSAVSGCHGDKNWRSRAYPGFWLGCLNYYIRIWVNHE